MKLEKNKKNPFKRVGQDYRGKQRGVGFCSFLVRCLDSATVFFFHESEWLPKSQVSIFVSVILLWVGKPISPPSSLSNGNVSVAMKMQWIGTYRTQNSTWFQALLISIWRSHTRPGLFGFQFEVTLFRDVKRASILRLISISLTIKKSAICSVMLNYYWHLDWIEDHLGDWGTLLRMSWGCFREGWLRRKTHLECDITTWA